MRICNNYRYRCLDLPLLLLQVRTRSKRIGKGGGASENREKKLYSTHEQVFRLVILITRFIVEQFAGYPHLIPIKKKV